MFRESLKIMKLERKLPLLPSCLAFSHTVCSCHVVRHAGAIILGMYYVCSVCCRQIDICSAQLRVDAENCARGMFQVITPNSTHFLQAQNKEAMQYWLDQLQVSSWLVDLFAHVSSWLEVCTCTYIRNAICLWLCVVWSLECDDVHRYVRMCQ